MKQEIWTANVQRSSYHGAITDGILEFLITKRNEGWRIVSVAPEYDIFVGPNEQIERLVGYIVIGEKEEQ